MSLSGFNLGIISGAVGSEINGKIAVHQSFGRVIDELAKLFSKCYMSLAICPHDSSLDYILQSDNIESIPQHYGKKVFEKVKHPVGILKSGRRVIDSSDIIFIRGAMPYLPLIHLYAICTGRPIVQWMGGDLRESLRWYPNSRTFRGRLRSALAWLDEKWFQLIRKSSYVYIVANGCELYEKYKSPRTTLVVSSTLKQDEFYYRDDTCQKDPVRILFVGFVRPGKGLKYLIEALSLLKTSRQVQLAIVGDTEEYSAEKARVKKRIDELGLADKVSWQGYARFGPELFNQLRRSDIFVLPTLSEGTPRVLVEARAFGVPVISTRVGGIPSSIQDGKDGILVPPRDSKALAIAIDKVIEDGDFRRKLISNGYAAAKRLSLEEFIGKLVEVFQHGTARKDNIMEIEEYIELLKHDDSVTTHIEMDKNKEVQYLQECKYVYKEVIKSMPVSSDAIRILDIGPTPFTIFLKSKFQHYDVWALDRTSLLEERFKQAGIHLKVCNLDNAQIPFEDEYFDVVIFKEVLEHIFSPPSDVLREVKRVMRPSAKLILGVPNIARLSNRTKLLFGVSPLPRADEQMKKGWVHGHGHIHEYTRKELLSLCKSVGLKVSYVQMLSISPLDVLNIRKKLKLMNFFYYSIIFAVSPLKSTIYIECYK